MEDLTKSAFVILLPALFVEIRSTQELEADTLEKMALGSHTDSFILSVIAKIRPAIALSFQKFGSMAVMLRDLTPSCH